MRTARSASAGPGVDSVDDNWRHVDCVRERIRVTIFGITINICIAGVGELIRVSWSISLKPRSNKGVSF
jgi:hypothetical protein